MRVLLIGTYELGRQPVSVASPAGRLRHAGHEVRAVDLAVQPYDVEAVDWADVVAISVPMHTAMRLGVATAEKVRRQRPGLPLALYGLYAAMAPAPAVDVALVGEFERSLVRWVEDPATVGGACVDLGIDSFVPPARDVLPPLEAYAHLTIGDEHRLVGAVESTHGCRHRCRHCPIPVVYDGRFRVVGLDVTLADVEWLVGAGAAHITFADPDFLNGPRHSMRVLDAVHAEFPELTFDITVKVEHLLDHADLIPTLVDRNVIFAISAFESTSDRVLRNLDKGHTVADLERVLSIARAGGLDLHPSWLPFTPWTEKRDVVNLFEFVAAHDLIGVTDPVQMSIRLLVPRGSLITRVSDDPASLTEYDAERLSHGWQSPDPEVDALQRELAAIVEADASRGRPPTETWSRMFERVRDSGVAMSVRIPEGAVSGRPRMTEPWFC